MARTWMTRYRLALVGLDLLAVALAWALALRLRVGRAPVELFFGARTIPYGIVAVVLCALWALILLARRAYEPSILGSGNEEFRRVLSAAVTYLATVAVLNYLLHISIARGYLSVALATATVLALAGRFVARMRLHRLRRRGQAMYRVVVVGSEALVRDLAQHLHRASSAGMLVVGACCDEAGAVIYAGDQQVTVLGGTDAVLAAVRAVDADVVAYLAEGHPHSLRDVAWELEGSGVELLVAPALTDFAGPRLTVMPVAGLPLVQVREPVFSGPQVVMKACYDRALALPLLVLSAPFLLLVAIAIRVDSKGPAIFRQTRTGLDGHLFTMYKLRTMVDDAQELRLPHDPVDEVGGAIAKASADPRVTRMGKALRRTSLDELPQLWNVLRGDMSLVGPRPLYLEESEQPDGAAQRRLLMKPGMTGLWQISGRSDLSWEERVRLDLYYVAHWSPLMDLSILLRTVTAIVRGDGAY